MSEPQPHLTNHVAASKSLGNFESFERVNNQQVIVNTSHGKACITIFNDAIFRISVSLDNTFEDFNYAVIRQQDNTSSEFQENDGFLSLSTPSAELEISKNPVRFKLKNKSGNIVNEDETFGTSWIGEQVTTYKKLQEGERFIGLGEKTGHLDRAGKGYQNWNTDYFGYGTHADPLYMSVPFYIGIHEKGVYGLYFNNSYKTHFSFGASNNRFSSFSADSGLMDYFLISGENPGVIIKNYTWLTGRMPLPPKWSLGYQQCRYSYYPDKEALSVATTFREKDIPADAIVLDIHYMHEYKIFSWDPRRFPDPKGLIRGLKEKGFNIVIMCDPGIKIQEGYKPYEDGLGENIFIKYPDGKPYEGQVWPGWCHFPDFTDPAAREWWKENMKDYTGIGVTGFWNDMNEIATWGNMLPELIEMNFDGHPSTARKGRNIYGMQMAKATYEATRENLGERPFNLTRAGFSGVQRYAAVWTGDNVASDEHMMLGVRLVNSLGISGVSFAGYDVGGFVGNADEKLFARWISIGAFAPFFRGHSMINSRDSEPWAYGEEVEEISRNYIKLRYRLLPYLYSLFHESATTGMPIARSLAIEYPHDSNIYHKKFENQYFFGPSLLVAPVESKKEIARVYLPQGTWYDLYSDHIYDGGDIVYAESPVEKLPVFVKGGSILTIQEAGENTAHKAETLELHVYKGNAGSIFYLYEDDGTSFDNEKGSFHKRTISFNGTNNIKLSSVEGTFKANWKNIRLYLHGFNPNNIDINGTKGKLSKELYRFILPISNFDPIGIEKEDMFKIESLHYTDLPYSTNEIIINW